MFDAKLPLATPPVTTRKTYYLVRPNRRPQRHSDLLSPSKDTRLPEVCKSQDDSLGRSQSPFGYVSRSIDDISSGRRVGTSRFQEFGFDSIFDSIRDAREDSGNTAYHLDPMRS
jgi:hypothetical protein